MHRGATQAPLIRPSADGHLLPPRRIFDLQGRRRKIEHHPRRIRVRPLRPHCGARSLVLKIRLVRRFVSVCDIFFRPAARERLDTETRLRRERARLRRQIRQWQQACNADDPDENAGMQVAVKELERQLETLPRRLEGLRKSGLRQISRTDPDSRLLRSREGWQLGYSAEIAVSEDHLIVAQRVTQNASDNSSLLPLVDEVERECGGKHERVSADSGFFSLANLHGLRQRQIEGYVPDANLSYELKGRGSGAWRHVACIHHP